MENKQSKTICYVGEIIKAKDTQQYYRATKINYFDNRILAWDLARNKGVTIPNELVIRLDKQERKTAELLYG